MTKLNKKILFIGKFFPIQGGISASSIVFINDLIVLGFDVHILTNSFEVESGFRQIFDEKDVQELMSFFEKKPIVHQLNRNPAIFHIPFSPAFEDRLFGKGLEIVELYEYDLIVSWYYQPYGIVAARLSEMTGIPFTVCNAGSDLGRLSSDSNLNRSYKWMLQKAAVIFTGSGSKNLLHKIYGSDIEDRVEEIKYHRKLPAIFTNENPEFDFEKYVDLARKRYQTMAFFSKNKAIESILPQTPLDKNIPILGMYGKCGEFKGTWDVINVLRTIASKNVDFQFIYLASGTESQLYKLYNSIFDSPELIGKVWILPAIPFLQVPSFIKKCDAVLVMERNAPISIHNVSTPIEILSVGTCLIVSEEVVSKSNFKNKLLSEVNSIIIESPSEHAQFAKVLTDHLKKDVLERIGKKGIDIFQEFNKNFIEHYSMATSINNMLN